MATSLPEFSFQQIERISRIIGDTESGLSGQEIAGILAQLRFPDEGSAMTKWRRLFNSLASLQNRHHVGNHTVQLINAVMALETYLSKRELFQARQEQLNAVLAFAGYKVRDDGRVAVTSKVTTLDEAFKKATTSLCRNSSGNWPRPILHSSQRRRSLRDSHTFLSICTCPGAVASFGTGCVRTG